LYVAAGVKVDPDNPPMEKICVPQSQTNAVPVDPEAVLPAASELARVVLVLAVLPLPPTKNPAVALPLHDIVASTTTPTARSKASSSNTTVAGLLLGLGEGGAGAAAAGTVRQTPPSSTAAPSVLLDARPDGDAKSPTIT
jgi:hypothetical protein